MSKLAINGGNPVNINPFPKWPVYDEKEKKSLIKVIESNKWGSTKGNEVKEFENEFSKYHKTKYGIATTSGTTALSIALKAAGVGPGDEVILPGYTFIASATSILDSLAKPVFADIDLETFNISPKSVAELINERTKAIMPVHFAGRLANMDALENIAIKNNLIIIEDACQAWGSYNKNRYAGCLGTAVAFSFQSSKNITAGEGGIILTNDEKIAETAKSISNCGRSAKGLWYAHYIYGGNYRMTEFQGAVLRVQLSRYPELHKKRENSAKYLYEKIKNMDGYITLEPLDENSRSSWHIFVFRINSSLWNGIKKDKIIEAIRAEGVPISPGYALPIYKQPVFTEKNFGPNGGPTLLFKDQLPDFNNFSLKNSDKACFEEALWLTQNVLLSEEEMLKVIIDVLEKVYNNKNELMKNE